MRIEGPSVARPIPPLVTLKPLQAGDVAAFGEDGLGIELSELSNGSDEGVDPHAAPRSLLGSAKSWWNSWTFKSLIGGDAPLTAGDRMQVTPVGSGYHLIGSLGRKDRKDLGKNQDARASLEAMQREAKAAGIDLTLNSNYRSIEHQKRLWERSDKTGKWVARPGSSEHHTGLAFDLGTPGYGKTSKKGKFEQSPAYRWMRENAYRFGFVQSMSWESWHWRYDPQGVRDSLDRYNHTPSIPKPPETPSLWQRGTTWLKQWMS